MALPVGRTPSSALVRADPPPEGSQIGSDLGRAVCEIDQKPYDDES